AVIGDVRVRNQRGDVGAGRRRGGLGGRFRQQHAPVGQLCPVQARLDAGRGGLDENDVFARGFRAVQVDRERVRARQDAARAGQRGYVGLARVAAQEVQVEFLLGGGGLACAQRADNGGQGRQARDDEAPPRRGADSAKQDRHGERRAGRQCCKGTSATSETPP